VGQFELDLPFTQARSINISPYDIYTQANFGASNQNVNNVIQLADAAHGVEFSGGHQYGGYHYSVAVVDQSTSGTSAGNPANVPTPTGGQIGVPGVGFVSDTNYKDIYARFSYRFNLEKDPASRHDVQAAGATGPRDHTYLSLGTFYYEGRSNQHFTGYASDGVTPAVISAREPFYRVGGDFSFNYRNFNLFGLYMYGHDHDLVLNSAIVPTGFIPGAAVTFNGGFLEADYLVLPWVMTIMRWDRVQSTADFLSGAASGNYFSPAGSTRDRFTPGVQFLIHPNIKASFEYQYRPQQALYYSSSGQTVEPFRTNVATGALEFVY
jgi:hypothetical protein